MCHKIFSSSHSDETCVAKLLKEINYAIKQAALERKVNGVNKNYATKYTYIQLYIRERKVSSGMEKFI